MVIFNVSTFQMDKTTSFLENPLDRNLYETKKISTKLKPLRILITEAGSKIAYNLIYKICSGSVFGPDQEIIIHLINSKGTLHHKAIILELEECGFHCCKDFVISSNPAVATKDVDFVIAITTFEEIPGWEISGTIVQQTVKALQLTKHVETYASKDCKIIFTGPATKSMMFMLSVFQKFDVNHFSENISCVTHLDTVISKAVLATKLKTTTDRIKNVIIWSNTFPDIRNATVKMYLPNDFGAREMADIPIADAVQDDEWLYTTFGLGENKPEAIKLNERKPVMEKKRKESENKKYKTARNLNRRQNEREVEELNEQKSKKKTEVKDGKEEAINRRVLSIDLLNHGKAVALSTIHHLKVLFEGSDKYDEIISMGVVTPSTQPYGLPKGCGLSYPVTTQNGQWKILQNVPTNVCTQINMMKSVYALGKDNIKNKLTKVVAFLLDYEVSKKQVAQFFAKNLASEVLNLSIWSSKHYVIHNPAEEVESIHRYKYTPRKSIVWDDAVSTMKKFPVLLKPSIRFSQPALENSYKRHSCENPYPAVSLKK